MQISYKQMVIFKIGKVKVIMILYYNTEQWIQGKVSMQNFQYELRVAKQPIHDKELLSAIHSEYSSSFSSTLQQHAPKLPKYQLNLPLVPVLFAYRFQHKNNPKKMPEIEVQIDFEDTSRNRKLRSKVQDEHQIAHQDQHSCLIYRLLQLETSQSYAVDMQMTVNVKYGSDRSQFRQFGTLKELAKSLGQRKFGAYNDHVHCVVKQIVMIKDPVAIQYKYKSQAGYLWIKISHSNQQQTPIIIHKIQLRNSLVFKNQKLRKFISELVPSNFFQNCRHLAPNDAIAVIMTLPTDLSKVQIPYLIEYSFPQKNSSSKFYMTKSLMIS